MVANFLKKYKMSPHILVPITLYSQSPVQRRQVQADCGTNLLTLGQELRRTWSKILRNWTNWLNVKYLH